MRKRAKINGSNFQAIYSLQMSTNHDDLIVTYARGYLWKKIEALPAKSYMDPGMAIYDVFQPP